MSEPFDVDTCDPGIRQAVADLRAAGFDTCDSGDGITKPEDERAFGDIAHVVASCRPFELLSEARRMLDVLRGKGHGDRLRVEASFDPADNSCVLLATWEVA